MSPTILGAGPRARLDRKIVMMEMVRPMVLDVERKAFEGSRTQATANKMREKVKSGKPREPIMYDAMLRGTASMLTKVKRHLRKKNIFRGAPMLVCCK